MPGEHKERALQRQIRLNRARGSLGCPWSFKEQIAALEVVALARQQLEDPQAPALEGLRAALLAFDTDCEIQEARGPQPPPPPDQGGLL